MVITTNDTEDFFEKQDGEIYIYGCGQYGYWTGHFMKKCGIDYTAYLDGTIPDKNEELFFYGKRVFHPIKRLKNIKGQIRIIIANSHYAEILKDLLLWHGNEAGRLLCLVPEWEYFGTNIRGPQINMLLAYFRNRLLNIKELSMISNCCVAGLLYEHLGFKNIYSPTINTAINAGDFMKLMKDPKHYLNTPIKNWYRVKYSWQDGDEITFAGRIDDIEVIFGHSGDSDGDRLVKRWNYMCSQINWDHILFIFGEHYVCHERVWAYEDSFNEKYDYPFLYIPASGCDDRIQDTPTRRLIRDKMDVIETYYDLLGNIKKALQ